MRISTRVSAGRLTGVKWPVPDGALADELVVAARTDDGRIVLAVTDAAEPGVARRSLPSLDPTRNQAEITFDGVTVELLDLAEDGGATLKSVLDRAAILLAFEQLGGASACLDVAVLCPRALCLRAPNRLIQAIRRIKLADIYVAIELARSMLTFAAWTLERDPAILCSLPLPHAYQRPRLSKLPPRKICRHTVGSATHGKPTVIFTSAAPSFWR